MNKKTKSKDTRQGRYVSLPFYGGVSDKETDKQTCYEKVCTRIIKSVCERRIVKL